MSAAFKFCGKDKKRIKENGEVVEQDNKIDLIIEENGVLYPIEIADKVYGGCL